MSPRSPWYNNQVPRTFRKIFQERIRTLQNPITDNTSGNLDGWMS